jgi:hypothetical protein
MLQYRFLYGDTAYLASTGQPVTILAARTQSRTARYTVLFCGQKLVLGDLDLLDSKPGLSSEITNALAHIAAIEAS